MKPLILKVQIHWQHTF